MNLKKLGPVLLIGVIVLVTYVLPALSGSELDGETGSVTNGTTTDTVFTEARISDLPPIAADNLPLEALDTISLIDSGGPFPFDRDDLVFQNREGLLPDHPQGYYREYTVITPGENDRGARRIVSGDDGELYYTADHYSSFSEIQFP